MNFEQIRRASYDSTEGESLIKLQKKSLRGALQKYARPESIAQESNAWENAVEEKYGDR
ncbi:MAG: hypothetical protein QNJ72_12265 [Pleurocapsa sp. MO_226.B13]|nr:hypothetical protein [Pleurocapsa sp. MO_226.B13]